MLTRKLLVVEDNRGDARLLQEMLREAGSNPVELAHVTSMSEAETHLAANSVDFVLLDLGLPDASGVEAVRRARAAAPGVPIVVLSGRTEESLAVQALHEGAQDYLVKGQIETRNLLRALRYALERKTLEDSRSRLVESNLQLEVELEQARRLESLGQLAGGVAHDFNNLLGVIMNYASFVNEAITVAAEGPDAAYWARVHSDVAQIERAAERAVGLTRQLLMFARRQVVQATVLDLNLVVSDVDALLRRTIGEHIELVLALSHEPWSVCADAGQLGQVLMNLAVNARGAMPTGGTLRIDTSNEVIDEQYAAGHPGLEPGRYVRLRVRDTGTGMEPAVLKQAFDPFFTTKPLGEGTGFGLATVHGIITQAGGNVHITSSPGVGTTVSAFLPEATGPLSFPHDPIDGAIIGGTETILVVEDEDAMREVTRRVLARNGYRVLIASSGAEALSLTGDPTETIHLLLSDVIMPKLLGTELADKVRVQLPEIRVLFMSGYALPVMQAHRTLEEDHELLEKPFSERALTTKVREVLDRSRRSSN